MEFKNMAKEIKIARTHSKNIKQTLVSILDDTVLVFNCLILFIILVLALLIMPPFEFYQSKQEKQLMQFLSSGQNKLLASSLMEKEHYDYVCTLTAYQNRVDEAKNEDFTSELNNLLANKAYSPADGESAIVFYSRKKFLDLVEIDYPKIKLLNSRNISGVTGISTAQIADCVKFDNAEIQIFFQ